MNTTTENTVRTNEAEYNMKIARKHGSVFICQTLIGNVELNFSENVYTLLQIPSVQDFMKDETLKPKVIASGKKSEVIESLKAVFEIVEN